MHISIHCLKKSATPDFIVFCVGMPRSAQADYVATVPTRDIGNLDWDSSKIA
jgi:hypothetical protein